MRNPDNTPSEHLREFQRKGFLFHGSSTPDITQLDPRKGDDSDFRKAFSKDISVYAACDPAAATIFSIMPPRKMKGMGEGTLAVHFGCDKEPTTATIPSRWRDLIEERKGFVYILPKDTFEGMQGQYKSKFSVRPVGVVAVGFEDFEALGGVFKWTAE